ncbi:MAG: nucleoside hydrolase [Microthrixaceae bacterium]
MRILIDTDPGMGSIGADPEDAMAILYALGAPGVCLEGVTVVHGNVPVAHGHPNALHALRLAGREDIAVVAGASGPRDPTRRAFQAAWLAQRSSLASRVPPLTPATSQEEPISSKAAPVPPGNQASPAAETGNAAAEFLCEQALASPGEFTLVAIGPLTNVAAAIELHPDFAESLDRLVIMGGTARVAGNITPAAEFNIWMDPDAAEVVLDSGAAITMVGLDVCHQTAFDRSGVDRLLASGTELATFAAESSAAWIEVREAVDHGGGALHLYDSLAVAAAIEPDLLTYEEALVLVETGDGPAQGMTVTHLNPVLRQLLTGREPNVRVALGVDSARFHSRFAERVTDRL